MTERAMPSLDLVRRVTDRHVVDQLIESSELTRADLAARTGISKPTISESVRRLEAGGLVVESGRQSGKRGPSGVFYGLRGDAGYALTISIGPGGVIAETSDLRTTRLERGEADLPGPVRTTALRPVLDRLIRDARRGVAGRPISAAVNVAGPVDQRTGRVVQMPNSPYFLDEFRPADVLQDLVDGPIRIDNDVNWTAAAERAEGSAAGLDDFVYAYLGPGIGSAVFAGGVLVRGHRGLAGELANVLTEGPHHRSRRLADCFADWGLRTPGSEAIDLAAVTAVLTDDSDPRGPQIARAVAAALGSLATALDPEVIVVGGPWARAGGLDRRIAELVTADPATSAEVRPAGLGGEAAHVGARTQSVAAAREVVLARIA